MRSKFEIWRQDRETNLSVVRRFGKRIKESGIIRGAKKSLFKRRSPSQAKRKMAALRRIAKRKEYEQLRKLGKI